MADYSEFGPPTDEWLTLVRKAPLPDLPPLQSPDQRREFRNKSNKNRFRASQRSLLSLGDLGVTTKTVSIQCSDFQEIGARVYSPSATTNSAEAAAQLIDTKPCNVLLYFHGGGFCSGGLSTEDATCVRLARNCSIQVVAINYRHTPEWTFPTQFDDAWDARCKILDEPQIFGLPKHITLYVAGISSGACLAASLVVRERITADIRVQGQALWAPWLCHPQSFPTHKIATPEKSSPVQCRDAPLLSFSLVKIFADMLQVEDSAITNVLFNPLLCDDAVAKQMPPTHILVCGNDPLRDHGMIFGTTLDSVGVKVRSKVYPGLPHGFARIDDLAPSSEWDNNMEEGIDWLLQNHQTQ